MIAMGTRGMAAIRSALNWQPVLAHASSHAVTALYLAHSAGKAAFVTEWDSWRDAGVSVGRREWVEMRKSGSTVRRCGQSTNTTSVS